MNRRQLLSGTGIGLVSALAARASEKVSSASDQLPNLNRLSLSDYQPSSMLHTLQSRVERARYRSLTSTLTLPNPVSQSTGLAWPQNGTSTRLPMNCSR